jgi:hypothetical protein
MYLGEVYIAEETMHDRLEERRARHAAGQSPGRDDAVQSHWLTRHSCSLLCKLGRWLVTLGAWLETQGQLAVQH